jgi:putative sigma-54 modulation protein
MSDTGGGVMHVEIKGVHLEVTEQMKEHVEKRLPHLDYAKDMIIDLLVTITKGKGYDVEANINFRWGSSAHIKARSFDIFEGVDALFHKIDAKVTKEKKRIQDHSPRTP